MRIASLDPLDHGSPLARRIRAALLKDMACAAPNLPAGSDFKCVGHQGSHNAKRGLGVKFGPLGARSEEVLHRAIVGMIASQAICHAVPRPIERQESTSEPKAMSVWQDKMVRGKYRQIDADPCANSAVNANRSETTSDAKRIGTIGTGVIPAAAPVAPPNRELLALLAQTALCCEGAVPQVLSARHGDVADRIAAYHDRMAICLEAGDVPEAEARQIAMEEAGAPIETLAELQVAAWRNRIESLPPPTDPALTKLKVDLLSQLSLPWVTEAARLGWTAIEVFGVHPLAPVVRVECWGVAVSVAISPFNRTVTDRAISARLRCEVCEVTANRIRFLTPTGARFARGLDEAVCIWELAGFVATVKH